MLCVHIEIYFDFKLVQVVYINLRSKKFKENKSQIQNLLAIVLSQCGVFDLLPFDPEQFLEVLSLSFLVLPQRTIGLAP